MQPFKLVAAEYSVASKNTQSVVHNSLLMSSTATKEYHANGKSAEHKEAWIGAIRVAKWVISTRVTYEMHRVFI